MKTERIIVNFLPDGTIQIEVEGVKGKKCLELTKPLEEALFGKKQLERQHKPEFYQKEVASQKLQQKQ